MKRAEAPRLLEYSWGGNDLRWELEPLGSGTRLTLWHNIDRRFISWGAAGWHICFDVLERLLAGEPIGRIVGADAMKFDGWQRLTAEYAKQFGVESAPKLKQEEEPMESTLQKPALVAAKDHRQSQDHRLLDRHRALLPADGLHRLRAAAPAAGGGGVHPPRLPRLLPGGALVGQAPRRGAAACAGAGAAQGVGLRRLRHHLASALIAHFSVGDGPEAWGWAAATGVLWGLSYFFWRRLQATPAGRNLGPSSARALTGGPARSLADAEYAPQP